MCIYVIILLRNRIYFDLSCILSLFLFHFLYFLFDSVIAKVNISRKIEQSFIRNLLDFVFDTFFLYLFLFCQQTRKSCAKKYCHSMYNFYHMFGLIQHSINVGRMKEKHLKIRFESSILTICNLTLISECSLSLANIIKTNQSFVKYYYYHFHVIN